MAGMRRAAAVGLLAFLAACSKAPDSLSGVTLPKLGGGDVATASCPTEKCFTAYVAPWCGYCRAATPALIQLKAYLKQKDVEMRVVVGMDEPASVKEYAAMFGPDAVLDPENAFGVRGGVPHFFVTDKTGRILREVPGMPRVDSVQELAAFFGLP